MCVAHSRTVEIERDMESLPKPPRQGNRLMTGIAKVLNRNGKACSGTVSSRSSGAHDGVPVKNNEKR